MNPTTASPTVIDTELAALYGAVNEALAGLDRAEDSLHHVLGDRKRGKGTSAFWPDDLDETIARARQKLAEGSVLPWNVGTVESAIAEVASNRATINDNLAACAPLEAEHERRGWTRYFLVTSSAGGHVHAHPRCSQRGRTTYAWLPALSDLTPADAVEAHGPLLCSKCFPHAPVEWTVGLRKHQG